MLLAAWLLPAAGSLFASTRPDGTLMPVPSLEREESNTDTPFGPYREKSAQRFIYTRKTTHLVTELNYRHVLYKDLYGVAPEKNYLYQASFKGYNMSSPLEFKVGRIVTGNNSLQTVDGISWFYPSGNRLKTTVDFGRIASIDSKNSGQPSFAEGRLHYSFNDNAYMAVKAVRQFDQDYGGAMLGYNAENFRVSGEAISGGATDSARLSLQYFEPGRFDLTSDYQLFKNDTSDSGVMRHYVGLESGQMYVEGGVGSQFWFSGPKIPDAWFYDGNVSFTTRNRDRASLGYLVETDNASTSRTIYGRAERRISSKTTFGIGVEDTRFEKSGGTVQNLEGRLNRRVQWGWVELSGAVISGASDSNLQKDIKLRAGYEF
ncbi:MAG: hypothetical protein PHD82_02510 [Candidatus Riflebacteria bacterium]|jgi:hypothetical protein|nr:hypothetical protein [Candidatus Riflebacteria bacterium]